ncbi:adenylyl-sulfate kinase [Alkalicoccus urumqiensis]|uniref:Adenylyl-sulfate kinase n=1 Tax=Alkalicoccus urumqiensis TaxID=1548213 RepID=A0A2P6MGD5_ALKUR|nr:adenylyl-sulfate kinase [Alkalicoccus urumqiensis]PRO65339.1 adenylyl-sulfate kinase [Alkalicoccus urumqiensis]
MEQLLRFITCGSVDDGKSTLIGHLLYDAKLLYADQERALELDSRVGSRGGEIDYSLLLDGLTAEREQGITIDAAYRYFTTDKRSFIVADTPGHEEYTRNMAVGASTADAAVLLVDASKGISTQTRRHARICSLMGIRHFILAVNKMDLIDFDAERFAQIEQDFRRYTASFSIQSIQVIPVSATDGDNVTKASSRMPWYKGAPLLQTLETLQTEREMTDRPFVLPVQRVSRPDSGFRGFQGQVESGTIHTGSTIYSFPSGEQASVENILRGDEKVQEVTAGDPVTIQLDREVDVSRGCVLSERPLINADELEADILWMDDTPLVTGRSYLLKLGTRTVPAQVSEIKHQIDIHSGEPVPASKLYKNELALVTLQLNEPSPAERFDEHPVLGSFILMDRLSNMTSACGVVEKTASRKENIQWQETEIGRAYRAEQKAQQPAAIWFTGLSGSGKSTLADELEKRLAAMGKHTMLLDGDNLRHGLNSNLGFSEGDRVENIRRAAETAKLMNDAGLIVLASFISPFKKDRRRAREIIGGAFLEVYVSTPLDVCEQRDTKGLYAKARSGEISSFTGISSPYETPEAPELTVDTSTGTLEEQVEQIISILMQKDMI